MPINKINMYDTDRCICQRKNQTILCTLCGVFVFTRILRPCRQHPNVNIFNLFYILLLIHIRIINQSIEFLLIKILSDNIGKFTLLVN